MRLGSYLVLLTLATLLPMAVFAAIVGYILIEHQRETFSRGAQERTLALLTAVDAELWSSLTTVQALAVMPSLQDGDLRYFRRVARQVLASQRDWLNIELAKPDGQQLMNLSVPEGARLPLAEPDETFEEVAKTRRAVVSDLAMDPVLARWSYSVRAPVIQNGALRYVLSADVSPDSIGRIISAQRLGPDWGAAVLDWHERFVARNWNPEKFMGQLASQSLRDALAHAPSGWFRGRTVEGKEVYSPYRRSQATGWAVSMGVPASALESGAQPAALLLVLGLLAAIGTAAALARLVARRISVPIRALAASAEAMGRGAPIQPSVPAQVSELRLLESALSEAEENLRERYRLEERERNALRAADRAKDEFLAMLSHELRNPLTALTTAAGLLEAADPATEAAAYARDVIGRQTQHMARLIGDLLDVSRATMGKVILERERLNVAEVAAGIVSEWRSAGRFERHPVSLETVAVWVDADRARIVQIITNLLDNALKFTPAGKPISVVVSVEDGFAVLKVEDAGEGLAPQALEHVFELFVQGQPGHQGGMGIGLALVKRLVELHGGRVSAASAGPGRGTSFIVLLPAI